MCVFSQDLVQTPGAVSIMRARNHKFDHTSLTKWIASASDLLKGILKQWIEDTTLLEDAVKSFMTEGNGLIYKDTILDKERAPLRKAMMTCKSWRPCKNGTALLAKWRGHLRALHQQHGVPDGERVLRNVGETVNTALSWCDLVECVHQVSQINEQKNVFVRKASDYLMLFLFDRCF